jgi:hypothetical protein
MADNGYHSFMTLNEVLRSDHRRRIIDVALNYRSKASGPARVALETALRNEVKVKKFGGNPLKAGPEALLDPTVKGFRNNINLIRAILIVWMEARKDLREPLRLFLVERNIPCLEVFSPYGFRGAWNVEELAQLVFEFCQTRNGLSELDVAFMLSCLTGRVPLSDETMEAALAQRVRRAELSLVTMESESSEPVPAPASVQVADQLQEPSGAIQITPDGTTTLKLEPEIQATTTVQAQDPQTALQTLRQNLNQALGLVDSGEFDVLESWATDYSQHVHVAAELFRNLRQSIREQTEELEKTIGQEVAAGDAEPLLTNLRQVRNSLTGSPTSQIEALKTVESIRLGLDAYKARRREAVSRLSAALAALDQALGRAQAWQLDETTWQTMRENQPEASASTRELDQAAKQFSEVAREIVSAINEARSQLVAVQLDRCAQIRAQLQSARRPAKADALMAALVEIETNLEHEREDDTLQQIPGRLDAIQAQSVVPDLEPELIQAASAYLAKHDQAYLDIVLEALWAQGRMVEAFVLLAVALRSARWKTDTALPENGLPNYVRGLLNVTPSAELVSAAIDMCADGLLANLVGLERPAEKSGMLILYTSLLVVRPTSLPNDTLWKFKDIGANYSIPSWARLADGMTLEDQPLILHEDQIDAVSTKSLKAQLDEEFRREGGKYVHLAGKGSLSLVNMEQKSLRPAMEKTWKTLLNTIPSHPHWAELKQQLEEMEASKVFEEHCKSSGLSPSANRHFQDEYTEALNVLLGRMREYVSAREAECEITEKHPVTWDALLQELDPLRDEVGAPIIEIAEAALGEAMHPEAAHPIQGIAQSVESFERRIRRVLLGAEALCGSFAPAIAWLGQESLNSEGAWGNLLNAIMLGLAQPLAVEQVIETFMRAEMPHLAKAVAQTSGRASEAQQAHDLLEQLETQARDRQAELEQLGSQLSEWERIWLEEKRYRLALRTMIGRIEQLRTVRKQEEASQREALSGLYRSVTELDPRVVQRSDLPAATREEAWQALNAVREVYLRSEVYKLKAAQEVLAEVRHLLEYQGATSDGLVRATENLMATTLKPQASASPLEQLVKQGAVAEIVQALHSGDWKKLELHPDDLTEGQREDRAELLESWQRISGLPMDWSVLTRDDLDTMKRFAALFAKTTRMYYGVKEHNWVWSAKPIPNLETNSIRPKTAAMKRGVVLIFVTEQSINKRQLRELLGFVHDEPWLRDSYFLVFVAPLDPTTLEDWIRRRLHNSSSVVLNEEKLLNLVLCAENPSATGFFRRLLYRVAGPDRFDLFKFENLVDKDQSLFVGRRDWISSLVNSEQSHAVYGGRRIGKTSLLNAVDKDLQKLGVRTAYISAEGSERQGGINIADQILQKLGILGTCGSLSEFKKRMTSFFVEHPDTKVVIFLDEVDRYIKARNEDGQPHDLIHILRSLHQEQHGRCRFILAGFVEMWKQLNVKGDIPGSETPWFNFMQDNGPLEGLSSEEAQSIAQQGFRDELGVRFASDAIPRLVVEATTGHPAFVQKFCERLHRRLYDKHSDELTQDDIQAVFEDRTDGNFVSFVNFTLKQNLNPLPSLVVYLLAIDRRESFSAENVRQLARSYDGRLANIPDDLWANSLDELRITSVIRTHAPKVYRFSVPSYPVILRQFELSNQDVIFQLIGEIVGKAKS